MSITKALFSAAGWKISGSIPPALKKYIVVVVPHTSWTDFLIGIMVRRILGRDIKYLAKASLFKGPVKKFMRKTGGYPVIRSRNTRLVDQIIMAFNENEEFAIAITPEATRKRVSTLRSGWYHIAKGAKVAVIYCAFDYRKKTVLFSEPVRIKDELQTETQKLNNFFQDVSGRYPDKGYFPGEGDISIENTTKG